jgi:hypothetical protein
MARVGLLISGLGVRFPRGAPNVLARYKVTNHPAALDALRTGTLRALSSVADRPSWVLSVPRVVGRPGPM